jgi:hypothetical protein
MIRHGVKALRLAPEGLHDWVNIGRKLPYLANKPLERSRRRGAKDPDESPWGARCTATQEGQACPDDANVREHRA